MKTKQQQKMLMTLNYKNKIQNNTFAVIKTSYDMHRKKYTGKSKEIHTAVTVAVLDGCGSLV